ncbi:DUF3192 domain-containing protein [Ferrimonas balearica]|uniref:DUF3192 domain-containing protein n=1 Tax=Ferrimonas balearica TaxID=44012 RepID=UPI001C99EE74|nr:DUF3192 domain-containing protein [Ferrimonas balearica]MBY5990643.1 DUF3192 domain-containing protein [Ferrimonas balearica]
MNKRTLLAATVAMALTVNLSGCIVAVDKGGWDYQTNSDWEKTQEKNRRHLEQVELGMALSQVRTIMGTADFNELHQNDGAQVQVLFYRTHRSHGDGKTSKDECTPIVLTDGIVTGWGDTAYQKAVQL